MSGEPSLPSILKDLADAISIQSRVANRSLLVLVVVCFVVSFPGEVSEGYIQLPFKLGSVQEQDFIVVGLLMISALIIVFCSAYAQAHRVQIFAYRILEDKSLKDAFGGHDGRDYFDSLRLPTIVRVAPLPQIARGEKQFFIDKGELSKNKKIVTSVYYLYLKLLSMSVFLGFPAFALVIAAVRYLDPIVGDPKLTWLVYPFVSGAFVVLIHVFIHEVGYIVKAIRAMTKF